MTAPGESMEEGVEWNREVQREAAEDREKEKTAEYAGHEVELLGKMREAVKELGHSVDVSAHCTRGAPICAVFSNSSIFKCMEMQL